MQSGRYRLNECRLSLLHLRLFICDYFTLPWPGDKHFRKWLLTRARQVPRLAPPLSRALAERVTQFAAHLLGKDLQSFHRFRVRARDIFRLAQIGLQVEEFPRFQFALRVFRRDAIRSTGPTR